MFNFGKPKTAGDWLVHVVGAVIALFLVWWLIHMFAYPMPHYITISVFVAVGLICLYAVLTRHKRQ